MSRRTGHHEPRTVSRLCVLLAAALLLAGCGNKDFLNENDKLRRENMGLKGQVKALTIRAESAEKQLEIEKHGANSAASPLPEGVAKPVVTRIEIQSPSRGIDTDKDGKDDAVRIYLGTYDRRDRFLQAVATVRVSIAAVPPDASAVTVASHEFDAKAFDDSYRGGIGGTHYTLVVPLTTPLPKGVDKVTVSVKLSDMVTGAALEAEKIVNVKPLP